MVKNQERQLGPVLAACWFLFGAGHLHAQAPDFWNWASRPVMGWNSWDFYGTTVTEAQTKAQADYMATNLLAHGWDVITVDIQWYAPNPASDGNYFNYETPNSQLVMDAYGRLQPATTRFPSATNGTGFTSLAGYVHSKGLKFGIHMMRGIPRQAVFDDLPVYGTSYTAQDIADTSSTCPWNPDMYGVDMSKPGAQEYYDALYQMYADWGVDFVKIDDISRPYDPVQQAEIEAVREAIDKTGQPIVLSLSPGATPLAKGDHVMFHANQWRISDDFWDNWSALYAQFQRLHDWTPYRGPGHFPDADMLPIGKIGASGADPDGRTGNFTQDEQYTLMSLWAIASSPLIHGGDMTQMDSFTLSLMTNDEVIAVNQQSTHNHQLFRDGDQIAWVADAVGSSDKYLAVFNTSGSSASVPVDLTDLGYNGSCVIRRLWDQSDLGSHSGTFSPSVNSHGAALYRLSGAVLPTPWITGVSATTNDVTVAWEEIASASSYDLKRALSEAGPFAIIASGVTNTSYTDSTVTNGMVYYYSVSAMIGGQESPNSNVRSARVPVGSTGTVEYWDFENSTSTGGTPANDLWFTDTTRGDSNGQHGSLGVNGTLGRGWNQTYGPQFDSDLVNSNGGSFAMDTVDESGDMYVTEGALHNWTSPEWTLELHVYFDGLNGWETMAGRDGSSFGSAESDFYFQRMGDGSDKYRIKYYTADGVQLALVSDTVLATGQWYGLAVVADSSAGTLTLYIDNGSGYVQDGQLAGLSGDLGIFGSSLNWTFGRGWYNGGQTDFMDAHFDNIRFSNGALALGDLMSLTPPPSGPVGVAAVSADSQISVSWNSVSNATSYAVKCSLTNGGPYTVVANPTTTNHVHSGRTNGTAYYYVVSSLNAGGESSNSVQVSAVPSVAIAPEEYFIAGHSIHGGTNLSLTVSNSVPGHDYILLATDTLTPPDWTTVFIEAGTGSDILFGIPIDPVSTSRFLKLDVQRQ